MAADETGAAVGDDDDDDCADSDVVVFELCWPWVVELDIVVAPFAIVVGNVPTFMSVIDAVVRIALSQQLNL